VHKCRHILQELGSPTVSAAQDWIERLGATTDLVWKEGRWLPVWRLLKKLEKDRSITLVPIRFVGGPPKGRELLREYRGSLYTFLLDRVLSYIEDVGLEVTESVLGIPQKV